MNTQPIRRAATPASIALLWVARIACVGALLATVLIKAHP
jgi:hypothetical protein